LSAALVELSASVRQQIRSDAGLGASNAQAVKLVVAMSRPLDRVALASALGQTGGIRLITAEGTLADASRACRELGADAILLDVSFPNDGAFATAKRLLERREVRAVIFLDQVFSMIRARKALGIPRAGYVTPDADVYGICNGIRELLQMDGGGAGLERTLCPHFLRDIRELKELDEFRLLELSPREYSVMVLLAQGRTVKEIAAALQLAENTIGNHRSRLMKKLRVRKAAQLTRVAVLAGCIN
jgi:two-component system invasion response regulator UvrY